MKVQFKAQHRSTDIPFPDRDLEPFSAATAQFPGQLAESVTRTFLLRMQFWPERAKPD